MIWIALMPGPGGILQTPSLAGKGEGAAHNNMIVPAQLSAPKVM